MKRILENARHFDALCMSDAERNGLYGLIDGFQSRVNQLMNAHHQVRSRSCDICLSFVRSGVVKTVYNGSIISQSLTLQAQAYFVAVLIVCQEDSFYFSA